MPQMKGISGLPEERRRLSMWVEKKCFLVRWENVIMQIENITDCVCAWRKEHDNRGEMVIAEVAIARGCDPVAMKSKIKEVCRIKLDPYKRPSKINIIDHLTINERFKKIRNTGM